MMSSSMPCLTSHGSWSTDHLIMNHSLPHSHCCLMYHYMNCSKGSEIDTRNVCTQTIILLNTMAAYACLTRDGSWSSKKHTMLLSVQQCTAGLIASFQITCECHGDRCRVAPYRETDCNQLINWFSANS